MKSKGYDTEKPSVKPKEFVSTRQRERICLCNRWCPRKEYSPPKIEEEEHLCEEDNRHESKRIEGKCASGGEREDKGKEGKRGMENFL